MRHLNFIKLLMPEHISTSRKIHIVLAVTAVISLAWSAITSAGGSIQLVSANREGTNSGNGDSRGSLFSADGRFVAFVSSASDLVENDTNNTYDIFVRDLQTGTTILASANRDGTNSGNGSSTMPALSADGRHLAFLSLASDLVEHDTNSNFDVFVRDLQTGTTTLVSAIRGGTNSGNAGSHSPELNADGRFVAFVSRASDLVEHDTNNTDDVFVRDLETGATILVSANREGTNSGNGGCNLPELSTDGRFVAFVSSASDLVSNDTNHEVDVFVRDLQTGTTTLASANRAGTNSGNGLSTIPALSADGRFVTFTSNARDLVSNDTNNREDVFVRDLQAGTTTLASANREGTNGGNNNSAYSALSADGRFVVFGSYASNLVEPDTNNFYDVFIRDLQTGTTTLVSANREGTNSGNGSSSGWKLSLDNRFVAFESTASDLVEDDTNNSYDVFIRDLQTGTTTLVSASREGTNSGNDHSYFPVISADGRFVAFESFASDLVSNDNNNSRDVFFRDLHPDFPPTVDAGGPYDVLEGGTVSLTAVGSDPEGGALAYAWDLDQDGSFETPGQSVIFSAVELDGQGKVTVAVQVTDNGNHTATSQATINLLNVAPTASYTTTSGVLIAGQSAWLAFSNPFDPSVRDTEAGFLYSYDCTSDGVFEQNDPAGSRYACAYPESGVFIATGRIQDKDGGFTDYTLVVTVLTPQQATEDLIDQVRELVSEGVLNQGQGNALISKLEAAIRQLGSGNNDVAINQMQAFINQVEAMISSGVLLPEEGQPLIDAANEIIAVLSSSS